MNQEIIQIVDAITCLGETLKSMNNSNIHLNVNEEAVLNLIGQLANTASKKLSEK